MQQEIREMHVGAMLDITLDEWERWLKGLTEAELDAIDPPVSRLCADMVVALRSSAEDPAAAQSYVQCIALMSDETLAGVIRMVTGHGVEGAE